MRWSYLLPFQAEIACLSLPLKSEAWHCCLLACSLCCTVHCHTPRLSDHARACFWVAAPVQTMEEEARAAAGRAAIGLGLAASILLTIVGSLLTASFGAAAYASGPLPTPIDGVLSALNPLGLGQQAGGYKPAGEKAEPVPPFTAGLEGVRSRLRSGFEQMENVNRLLDSFLPK